MCIAIVKPAGKALTEDRLKTCFENNPDGAGFAYRDKDTLVVSKGFFTFEAFLAAYNAAGVNDTDALVHFRITTRGDGTAMNCHPFELSCGALIHNGTISDLGHARGEGKSDTYVLSEQLYAESFDTLERLAPVLESHIDGTRVAVMGHDGRVLVLNRKQWVEDDGVLYSNSTYKSYDSGFSWGKRFSEPHVRSWGLDDYTTYGGYAEYAAPTQVTLETDNALFELDTQESTAHEGFIWINGELWVVDEDWTTWYRDYSLENEVLDDWHTGTGAYPSASEIDEFLDLTRWYVSAQEDTSTTNTYEKAI